MEDLKDGGMPTESVDEVASHSRINYERQKRGNNVQWFVLYVVATLNGRDLLRNVIPYPFYFTLLVQFGSFIAALCIYFLLVFSKYPLQSGRQQIFPTCSSKEGGLRMLSILLSSSSATVSMLYGAKALELYSSLPLLMMQPLLTYVSDSLFFRMARMLFKKSPNKDASTVELLLKGTIVTVCTLYLLIEELQPKKLALKSALLSSLFLSLSRLLTKILHSSSDVDEHCATFKRIDLLSSFSSILIATYAAYRYENVAIASHAVRSWSIPYLVIKLAPGALLHVLFNSWMLSPHPYVTKHFGGALEENTMEAKRSITLTFQASLCVIVIGAFNQERSLLEWKKAFLIAIIFVASVGPKHIGYCSTRFLNFISGFLRCERNSPHRESRQTKIFLLFTVSALVGFISSFIIVWVNIASYEYDVRNWHDPLTPDLDAAFRPPQMRSVNIIIAHNAGDSLADIAWLISTFGSLPYYYYITPNIKIYSQDPGFSVTNETAILLKGDFKGELTIQSVSNIGGSSAIYLRYILTFWDSLSAHTLFLSTSDLTQDGLQSAVNRLAWYYEPISYPLPDALPKTGFMNLGPMAVCRCDSCHDITGWSDTFQIVTPFWAATRSTHQHCDLVLLTYGNKFVASAARLRGVKRDFWQLLYDALVDEDINNAWAHAPEKLPRVLDGGIYGRPDSLEKPYLGLSVERLWAVFLQCNRAEIAWKCPDFDDRQLHPGNRNLHCGCMD